MHRIRSTVLLIGLCGAIAAGGLAAAATPETEAEQAADAWLALVDAGDYAQSWETASDYFKGAITKPQWEQMVAGVRKPLGAVRQRTLRSAQYTHTLPGAPDGEYVVLQYDTSFAGKAAAVETVTPKRDGDAWRVSGYYIK